MGTYINIGNAGFQRARNSEYVDKSGLIAVVNSTLNTEHSFSESLLFWQSADIFGCDEEHSTGII